MSDGRDQGREPVQDASWRRDSPAEFTLLVEGRAAATIDLLDNTAQIMTPAGGQERLAVPDSRSVFDAVEDRLKTGRIERWTGPDRDDAAAERQRAETQTARFREAVPPQQEAQHYLSSAWKWLDQGAHDRALSAEGYQAHIHVRAALREVTIHGHWTREAETHAALAREALDGADARRLSHAERQAGIDCDKADTCLRERQADHTFTRAIMSAAQQEAQRNDRERDRERE